MTAGGELRDGQPLKPGNYVTADNKISMRSESERKRWRGCEMVHCARTGDNTALRDLDTLAVKPSVPPRRPRQQNDASLPEAVRAHWREVVRRIRPVENTAQLDLDVDNTARLDPDTDRVKASVPPRRPGQQNDGSLHETGQAQWREVVRRARPVDNTARVDLDVDNTARLELDVDNTARLEPVTDPVRASVPPRRPGQQNDGSLREVVRASGRGGEVVRRVRPVDSASRLRKGAVRGFGSAAAAETAKRWFDARSAAGARAWRRGGSSRPTG